MDNLMDGPLDETRFRLTWILESGERLYCQPTHPDSEPWVVDAHLGAYLVREGALFGSLEADCDEHLLQKLLEGDGEEQLIGRYPYNCVIVPKIRGKHFTMYSSMGRMPLGRSDLEKFLRFLNLGHREST